ncbi:DUF692 domain-containing protein [Pseudoalteromonas denitrificans]|uniref:UPF0276 protein SAMN02745724_01317 n=1 Tax=Pseudoalteromonas denitrificans DSM 6059 TaxID=1123010 RepID=A0A1I1HYN2_9GAMM|nr:DUF692 domain-containing protein [Pseudoalteromonas denitrificans]SFC29299.1 hypothetical protein SAMN02745724_01317 [Pseudoalteromonas denitrificans DSM 6059]
MNRNISSFGAAGLGLRREMLDEMIEDFPQEIDFLEIAPENWLVLGGLFGKQLKQLTQKHQFVCHGLSLSIGSPEPLDIEFVKQLKPFFESHNIKTYSEHLSYCSGKGHMYDLMPIPFTNSSAHYVAQRIKQVQDILEMTIAIENVSYYAAPGQQMPEIEFINQVLELADCDLLLDVNNIYVNSVNHNYDAIDFLKQLPSKRIAYGHIAGHFNEADDLLVDTHGADVIDSVWSLLEKAYEFHGVFPTLLERDFNIPPLNELLKEVNRIKLIQNAYHVKGLKNKVSNKLINKIGSI